MSASQVQKNCMQVLIRAGKIEAAVKIAVMANLQEDGRGLFVYEARMTAEAAGLSASQFAGGLASLTAKGVYTPSEDPEYRGKFGYFRDIA